FVYYEKPFLETFERANGGVDPRSLPHTDERISRARALCFTPLFRELRQALDTVGKKRGKRFDIAMHAQNSVRNCLYYGIDIAQLAREGLLDIFYPDGAHFLPPDVGAKEVTPEFTAEFLSLARGTGMKVIPCW